MRICTRCNINKELSEYHKTPRYPDGLSKVCKTCRNKRVMELYYKNKENPKTKIQDGFKKCNDCSLIKPYKDFNILSLKKEGYRHNCRSCQSIKDKIYAKKSADKIAARKRKYYEKNKEYIIKRTTAYNLDKYKNDIMYRIKNHIRGRVKAILKIKRMNKNNSFRNYLGCSLVELRKHLESKFTEGMNWENYGSGGWVIDHIIPLSSATNVHELYKLNHYTNLQPLWEKENKIKSDNF
jgi:hypothetical protein